VLIPYSKGTKKLWSNSASLYNS